tara:strand:- start:3503 stop:3748 length:246 start_codon:yes stop_codon:yes gene_type:complete
MVQGRFDSSLSTIAILLELKLKIMKVKELIEKLKKLPQDLPVRTENKDFKGENEWVDNVEYSETGQSGYEIEGEVRLTTSL